MKTTLTVLALVFSVFLTTAVSASPEGSWEGGIDLPGSQLAIRVELIAPDQDAAWSGRIDIPAQLIRRFILADLEVDGNSVSFAMAGIPGDPVFEGEISDGGDRIAGSFRQSGQTYPFALDRAASTPSTGETPAAGVPGEGLMGHWQGSLRTGAFELRLVLNVTEEEDALKATIDSLDQGAVGIPVSKIAMSENQVSMELESIQGRFEGELSSDGSEISGRWNQPQLDEPLVFRRLSGPVALRRPQEPVRPYPYREREVVFDGGSSGVRLAGTLTIPEGQGPFPAVALMSGSGPQDRDEALMGHRPFLVLADYLTRRGIAVLRYDDRGFARSTGNFAAATHEDFAADGRAAFEFLKKQSEIDPRRVGLCGHSEGGVHVSLVAAEAEDVAFVVMLAGVGVPLDQLLVRQRADLMRVMGVEHRVKSEEEALVSRIFEVLREQGSSEESRRTVQTLQDQILELYTPEQLQALGASEGMVAQQTKLMTSPWFVKLLSYDPAATLARVRAPVLALNGELDLQVAWQENLEGIRRGLEAGGNRRVTTVALTGLNHLFQRCETGAITEYGQIEETMSPEVLERVGDWILQISGS